MAARRPYSKHLYAQLLALGLLLLLPLCLFASQDAVYLRTDSYFNSARTLAVVSILFAIMIVGVCIWTYHHRLLMKRLLRLSQELRAARADVVRANHMKDLFVRNISHEIRTPLNAVMGFSQILSSPDIEISDNERREYGNYIKHNGLMLTRLIDDIINVADIEKGTFEVKLMPNQCLSICEAAISSVSHRVAAGVELKLDYKLSPDFIITTDGTRVQQLLTNFLTNACKHTTRGTITLRCEQDVLPNHVLFSVVDTGNGIPKAMAEDIFNRFKKLDDFKQGTGLGLYICHAIAQRLHGRVWCDAGYIDGARFCFSVPTNHAE